MAQVHRYAAACQACSVLFGWESDDYDGHYVNMGADTKVYLCPSCKEKKELIKDDATRVDLECAITLNKVKALVSDDFISKVNDILHEYQTKLGIDDYEIDAKKSWFIPCMDCEKPVKMYEDPDVSGQNGVNHYVMCSECYTNTLNSEDSF